MHVSMMEKRGARICDDHKGKSYARKGRHVSLVPAERDARVHGQPHVAAKVMHVDRVRFACPKRDARIFDDP